MFLATTALDEFWDTSEELFFLGEWCKLFDKKDSLDDLSYKTLPFEWNNSEKIYEAYTYCNLLYEKVLSNLTDKLNEIHKLDKSIDFYRVILGNWLVRFIHQYYDKYISIMNATKYDNLYTYILDQNQYYIPHDIQDYIEKQAFSDLYNLQLYSDIIKFTNIKYDIKITKEPIKNKLNIDLNNTLNAKIFVNLSKVFKVISKVNIFNKNRLVIVNPYFKYNKFYNIFVLFCKSKFKFIFDDFKYQVSFKNVVDKDLRKNLSLDLGLQNDFEKILSETIFNHIPTLFLESFNEFRNNVKVLNIPTMKYYYTAQALHANNIFKFFVAENLKKISILTHQHGGAYGMDMKLFQEEYEKSISDTYYTWGWKGDKCKSLPFPNHKSKINQNQDAILFVMNNSPRYMYLFQFHAISSFVTGEYLEQAKQFLKTLKTKKIKLRSYPGKGYNTFLSERLKEENFNITYDDFSKKFDTMLAECKLIVADHLTTTWLESLAINKPTVVFSSKKYTSFRKEVLPYIKKLEEAKILFFTPCAAAKHIDEIENNIDIWWKSNKVQSARIEFVEKYAYTTDKWIDIWVDEFDKVLKD